MTDDPIASNDPGDETVEAGSVDSGEAPTATTPPRWSRARAPSPSMNVPNRIGQYHLKRAIGAGGMGTVYEAIQENPRRTVAVKLMRAGIASRSALRRFEYESQLLARLRHIGIAQVYDAGTYRVGDSTVPYFAMEYITGAKPITDYVVQEKLSTRERMMLFADVCEAVYHGHQKGIIHRDLKPSNILVDSSGQVKIIDFGVARSTDSDMAVTTLQTDVGQPLGTVQYMSPEQCAADPHDIDTRSDVYALGVILYEMLCDRLPYDVTGAAIHEATKVICEQEPARLSSFNKTLRGDVETITFKTLEKSRSRRYQSALVLVEDIKRYLNNEPISARPASAMYQLSKLVSRHKTATAAVVAAVLALTAGMIVSDLQRRRAIRAEELAQFRLEDAEASRDAARAAEAEAEQVVEFLTETLTAADPGNEGKDVLVRDVMDQAGKRVGAEFGGSPLIEARLRYTIGKTYGGLGQHAEAEKHLAEAAAIYTQQLGPRHEMTLSAVDGHTWAISKLGDYTQAEAKSRSMLKIRRRLMGNEHPDTLKSINNLAVSLSELGRYAEAEELHRQTLAIRRRVLGPRHPDTVASTNNLAATLHELGRYAEAE